MKDTTNQINELISKRILLFDGAMGTMIQALKLNEEDIRQVIASRLGLDYKRKDEDDE